MSIEYTIDIQLTELGFPDILQSEETSERQSVHCSATSADSLSSSVKSLPAAHKRLQINQHEKETDVARHTPNATAESLPSTQPPDIRLAPAESRQDVEAVDRTRVGKETSHSDQEPVGMRAAAGGQTEFQQDVHDESQDSQLTDMCDIEQVDMDCVEEDEEEEDEEDDEEEDNEEEEGHNSVFSHSRNYRCGICDLQLSTRLQFRDHMNLHSGVRPYICEECGKRFCKIRSYRAHLRAHARGNFQCRVCLKEFTSEEHLNFHLSGNHFEKEFFECDLCKRLFPSLSDCEKHVQIHKQRLRFCCRLCGRKFFSLPSFLRHQKARCSNNFKCTDCALTFPRKNALLKHSFSHLGLLPYTCIRCQRHFRLAKLYHQHKCEPERIHCVACLREFHRQEDFEQHKKDTGCWGNQEHNAKADEIRCLECGQSFNSSEELKKHAGAHQRVLKCAECGKGFRSALLLMSHMGGHAGKSPCLCKSCGLGFPHQQNYDSHLKTCGRTPLPAKSVKKHHTPKSPLPEIKTLSAAPELPKAPSPVTTPAPVLKRTSKKHAAPADKSPALQKASRRSGRGTNGVSGGSPSPDGLWKLTLDKEPPPGLNLVVFLPVCPPLTSGIPQTLALPAMQPLSQTALPAVPANSHFELNAAFGMPLNTPLNFLPSNNNPDIPLDLSQTNK